MAITLTYSATPFVVPEIRNRFDRWLGNAGIQAAGPALALFAAHQLNASQNGRIAAATGGVAISSLITSYMESRRAGAVADTGFNRAARTVALLDVLTFNRAAYDDLLELKIALAQTYAADSLLARQAMAFLKAHPAIRDRPPTADGRNAILTDPTFSTFVDSALIFISRGQRRVEQFEAVDRRIATLIAKYKAHPVYQSESTVYNPSVKQHVDSVEEDFQTAVGEWNRYKELFLAITPQDVARLSAFGEATRLEKTLRAVRAALPTAGR